MSPEERQLLAGLFDRTRAASNAPRDRDAEALIADAVRAQPYAPYLLAQTVLVQEEALRATNTHIQELEARIRDLESQSAPAASSFLGGIGQSLFGAAPRPAAPQPQSATGPWGRTAAQQPAPQPQGGSWGGQPQAQPWQQSAVPQSGGFLKGALGAAAGVAGGMLLADSIRGLMGGHNSPLGIGSGFGGGLGGETINNYYGGGSGSLADADRTQDQLQDALDGSDAQQDQLQDASDYGDDSGDYSDDSTDV